MIFISQVRATHALLEDTHKVLAYVLLALVVVHLVGALRHHFMKHDNVLRRMWFGIKRPDARSRACRLLLLCVLLSPAPAAAQDDVAAFYKGKVVRLIVGIGVGSGYDINARLLARFLPKYIPGNPTVIVQNQPGAGSLTHDQPALRRGPVRRHRDRRLVQRAADHAAAAADRRALRGRQDELDRQHQPRDPGDVCLGRLADHDARRSDDARR